MRSRNPVFKNLLPVKSMGRPSKRVLHVVYAMNTGGIESWLMSIYRQLYGENLQFDFLVNTKKEAFFDNEVKRLGGKIIYAGALNNPLKIYKTTKKILCDSKYCAVHCHNVENSAPVLKAAYEKGVNNRIYHSHNDFNMKLAHLSFLKSVYLKVSRLLALRYSNKFLAVSKSAGNSLFKTNNYQLLSLSIDISQFNPINEKQIVRRDFHLREDDFVIGHVGRFDTQKNHAFLLKVAKELIQLNPKTKIFLIGKGPLEEEIKIKITENDLDGYFVFVGLRSDVPQIMSNIMNAFLFPSLSEGLGLVLVEAQAAGLPIICSDVIPDEAIVNTDLVQKISLSQSTKEWAEVLMTHYKRNKHYEQKKAYKKIEGSAFNLNNTIKILEEIW
jgi:glycosyltransferase EpsF